VKGLIAVVFGLGLVSAAWSLSLPDLQVLIDKTPMGRTLRVPAGLYQGNLIVRNSVVLQFEPGAKLVHSPGTAGPTLWIQGSDVSVQGLEIEGTGEGTRRDHTAVLVTGSRVTLADFAVRKGWSGVWLDGCTDVTINNLAVTGLTDFPFWERGDAVRITKGTNIRLTQVSIRSSADGIYAERSTRLVFEDCEVADARYGLHGMFSTEAVVSALKTTQTVVGVMLMESSVWVVRDSSLSNGYRIGSAGVRQIRTNRVTIEGNQIARQASGVELIDVRAGNFRNNRITENGTAWTWGRDNSGTTIVNNVNRGNLVDFAGDEPSERALMGPVAHQHGEGQAQVTVVQTALRVGPRFDGNFWDAWRGTDLDQDGTGDTPYRFDRESATRAATRPWAGIFLGSPWSVWSQGLPGGEVIDEHPRTAEERSRRR